MRGIGLLPLYDPYLKGGRGKVEGKGKGEEGREGGGEREERGKGCEAEAEKNNY